MIKGPTLQDTHKEMLADDFMQTKNECTQHNWFEFETKIGIQVKHMV